MRAFVMIAISLRYMTETCEKALTPARGRTDRVSNSVSVVCMFDAALWRLTMCIVSSFGVVLQPKNGTFVIL